MAALRDAEFTAFGNRGMHEKLSAIRETIPDPLRRRDARKTWVPLVRDAALYGVGFLVACLGLPFSPVGGILAGMAIAALFIWAHDAAHGALMAPPRARFWGTLAMLPSGHVYALWIPGHNRVHHGFTSLVEMDWIWRPWSPAEYASASRPRRWEYRLERFPLMTFWTYTRRVWWPGMVVFRGFSRDTLLDKALVALFFLGAGGLAYALGGFAAVWWAVVFPFLFFQGTIGLVVYLNHTDRDTEFFDSRAHWNHAWAQLHHSVTWRCRPWAESWLHNILVHTPHHVDTRIPFYHLPKAFAALKGAYPDAVLERRFTWRAAWQTFRECQLYDYECRRWVRFFEVSPPPKHGASRPMRGLPGL